MRSRRRSSRCWRSWPTQLPVGRRVSLRAEVGRLSRDRLSRRRQTCSSRAATCGRSIATFPSCTTSFLERLPPGCVVDGEIVIATPAGSTSTRCRLRLHPAASRVAKLAEGDAGVVRRLRSARRRRPRSARARRNASGAAALERLLGDVDAADPPDADDARSRASRPSGSTRFEGAGLDGVIAKPDDGTYEPGKRAMIKVKHARTADCVVAGFRWHKSGKDDGRLAAARALRRRGQAAPRRRDVVVHDGDAEAAGARARAAARGRARRTSVARVGRCGGREHDAHARRRRAAGAPARICRGSRCGSSACAR